MSVAHNGFRQYNYAKVFYSECITSGWTCVAEGSRRGHASDHNVNVTWICARYKLDCAETERNVNRRLQRSHALFLPTLLPLSVPVSRCADIPGPYLGNGSVNTFLLLGSRFLIMQQLNYNSGRVVFSTWSVPRGYKRDEVWSLVIET
jgi:hypothetical protein